MFKSLNKGVSSVLESQTVGWLVVGAGVFLAWRLLRKTGGLIGNIKNSLDKSLLGDKVKSETGANTATYNLGYEIADKISVALGTKNDLPWYSKIDEDEESAAYHLNRIDSQTLANVVKQVYKSLCDADLYYHVNDYFDFVQIRWVNSRVLDFIK